MRKTKIVCTLGPASDDENTMRGLMLAGMNVARFNFSHGTHAEHRARLSKILKLRRELNLPVATLLDTKGPEIRTRDFKDGKVVLKEGQKFTLTTDEKVLGDEHICSITYKDLPRDVKPGAQIMIDDGLIGMRVDSVEGKEIHCTVLNGGPVSNHKGINVPGTDLTMPFISDQDREDLIFGCEEGFEFVAASFTRTAQDIRDIRKILKEHGSHALIIAKIESVQGVTNLEEILKEADGVMVARGDLGIEVPLEEVPVLQKRMIKMAESMGKICITATQMLDSMIHNPRPTRAEATDVANAIYDGTTAIMLSGETAAGKYPVLAVKTMSTIAERTERDIDYYRRMVRRSVSGEKLDVTAAISHSACTISEDIQANAIIAVTMSGFTAQRISRFKPSCPILACSTKSRVACQTNILFDVYPLIIPEEEREDQLFETAIHQARLGGYIKPGDTVVLTAGVPLGESGNTNMVRVIEVK
ncbi:MAG: pyruvate kinase [Lachnospiraceae bacterium]|jgi:pyruvate kinase|nr:pyruvate kinase [Lachnospiraceae bacterium]